MSKNTAYICGGPGNITTALIRAIADSSTLNNIRVLGIVQSGNDYNKEYLDVIKDIIKDKITKKNDTKETLLNYINAKNRNITVIEFKDINNMYKSLETYITSNNIERIIIPDFGGSIFNINSYSLTINTVALLCLVPICYKQNISINIEVYGPGVDAHQPLDIVIKNLSSIKDKCKCEWKKYPDTYNNVISNLKKIINNYIESNDFTPALKNYYFVTDGNTNRFITNYKYLNSDASYISALNNLEPFKKVYVFSFDNTIKLKALYRYYFESNKMLTNWDMSLLS